MLWLIVNPSAGDGRTGSRLRRTSTELSRLGLEHVVHRTQSLDHARELTGAALAAGAMPVAFGGDGLIGAVAGAVAHSDRPMGILPGGRGNDLARVLGIPRDPVRACSVLPHGVDRVLDLGRVGERAFLGILSCGLDSTANRVANSTRLVRGPLAYSYGGLRALAQWRPAQFCVDIDGEIRHFRGFSVAVANSQAYGGGMRLAPAAELDDGWLDVVTVADMPRLRFLLHMPEIFRGSHVAIDQVHSQRGREISVSADRPFDVYADGELVSTLPVTVRIDPAAVTVRVSA
jgi:YegS/Rv2252/BmrU family lipid kinase